MSIRLDRVEEAIADIAAGKAVVVVDDEDRENEGDIIFAAAKATPELMAFTIRYSSGVVCAPMPADLARYVVPKGSICVDGVSLTVVDVGADSFTVSLIPTTLRETTLGARAPGEPVNLEVDVIAKYVERLLGGRT